MSTDFRALCAELVNIVTAHCNPDDYAVGHCAAVLTRARDALDQPKVDAESLSPREVEAQEAFTKMRDVILSLSDGLEVNKVLRIIDNHTPEWV